MRFDAEKTARELRAAAKLLVAARSAVAKAHVRILGASRAERERWHAVKRTLSLSRRHAASAHTARLNEADDWLQGVAFDLTVASAHVLGAARTLPRKRR